jgi:hypothetical protein
MLCEMLKRVFLLRVSQPQTADDLRAANQVRSLPEIGSRAVEETGGIEASLKVDVCVQQDGRVCAQLVARILDCKWTGWGRYLSIARPLETTRNLGTLGFGRGCIFCSRSPSDQLGAQACGKGGFGLSCRHLRTS